VPPFSKFLGIARSRLNVLTRRRAAYVPYYESIASSYSSWIASVTSFWRSPQCTSMAKAVNSSHPPLAKRQLDFQGWNGNLGVPFGPGNAVHQVGVGGNSATCCGPCQVIAQTLSMLYWPKGSTTPVCSDGPVTSLAVLPSTSHLAARGLPSVNRSSVYAVVDGSTLYVFITCASRFVLKLLHPEPRPQSTWRSKARCGFQTFVERLGAPSPVSRSQWNLAWSRL